MTTEKLQTLEQRIHDLVDICQSLKDDNKKLAHERDLLEEKTNLVHERVKSMISEIKSLEGQV